MLNQIGRYKINKVLGSGGMATVYLANDPFIERQVAIKLMAHQLAHDDKLRQRFYQEAKVIAALENPNIVKIYDFGEQDGQPFLVMPYLTGGSLRERLQQRGQQNQPYTLAETLPIIEKMAAALHTAHRHNIVHRDVKPDNVLFDGEGNPYLSDFGIARQEGVTFNTAMLGTPTYISPEQSRNSKEIDGRSDVYSLTAMTFELLSLRPPFASDDLLELMRLHREQAVPNIRQWRPDLPIAVQRVLEKGLAKEPANRYFTTTEFVAALRDCAINQAQTVVEPWPTPPPQSQPTPPPLASPTPRPTVAEVARSPYFLSALGLGTALFLFVICGLLAWPFLRGALSAETTPESPVLALSSSQPPTSSPTTTPSQTPTPTSQPTNTPTSQPTNTPLPTTTPTPAAGEVRLVPLPNGAGEVAMVYVPGGSFLMGSADGEDGYDNERPQHTVYLDPYWLDRTEVTNEQFAAFVAATGYKTTAEDDGGGYVCGNGDCNLVNGADWQHPQGPASSWNGLANHPVVQVSWDDADAFCQWRGASLPTEAQWEKGARGNDGRIYPWGNSFDGELLNYCDHNCQFDWADDAVDDGYALTAPVGSYPAGASPYGLLDMAGNVWEWTQDWYNSDYYDTSPDDNPLGPAAGDYKVLRGGSWYYDDDGVRVAFRYGLVPTFRDHFIGFRCVQE